jgi:hypothetical protein
MIKMIKLIDILKKINESKQVGILYHFTPLSNLKRIIETQFLFANDEQQISTTRHANMDILPLYSNTPDINKSLARIMLDGDKISTKYKIRPFSYDSDGKKGDLGEEQIIVDGGRFPLIPYLKRIDIFLNKKEKVNPKILELLEKVNIPYKIYQGTPTNNIPYIQPKTGNPEDINIKNIRKKEIYTKNDMLYPGMKKTSIKVFQDSYFLNINHPSIMTVWTSPKYPDYYVTANEFDERYYYKWFNLKGEKFDIKEIPLPMRDDPEWMKKWKDVEHPGNLYRDMYKIYILIPKNQV